MSTNTKFKTRLYNKSKTAYVQDDMQGKQSDDDEDIPDVPEDESEDKSTKPEVDDRSVIYGNNPNGIVKFDLSKARPFTATAQNVINEYLKDTVDIHFFDQQEQIPVLDQKNDYKLYVIGDLEGSYLMILNWFRDMKLINDDLKWIAPNNVYVIQLGDSLDDYRRKYQIKEKDYNVTVLFDILNRISNNHVLSVWGNHELINIQYPGSNFYGENHHDTDDQVRKNLFSKNGLIYNILSRRNYIINFGRLLFSHAGVYQGLLNIKNPDYNIDNNIWANNVKTFYNNILQLIKQINGININELTINIDELELKTNDPDKDKKERKKFVEEALSEVTGILWNRKFHHDSPYEYFLTHFINVIGHNSSTDIDLFFRNNKKVPLGNIKDQQTKDTDIGLIRVDTTKKRHICDDPSKEMDFIYAEIHIGKGKQLQDRVSSNRIQYIYKNVYKWNCNDEDNIPKLTILPVKQTASTPINVSVVDDDDEDEDDQEDEEDEEDQEDQEDEEDQTPLEKHLNYVTNFPFTLPKEKIAQPYKNDIQIHCLVDLNYDNVLEYLQQNNFLTNDFRWIAPMNTYIVHLGNQIRCETPQDFILLFDFLNYISKGHVVSVIGDDDLKYLLNYPIVYDSDPIINKILLRRNYIIEFKHLLFSNSGLRVQDIVQIQKENTNLKLSNIGSTKQVPSDFYELIQKINQIPIATTQPTSTELQSKILSLQVKKIEPINDKEFTFNDPYSTDASYVYMEDFVQVIEKQRHNFKDTNQVKNILDDNIVEIIIDSERKRKEKKNFIENFQFKTIPLLREEKPETVVNQLNEFIANDKVYSLQKLFAEMQRLSNIIVTNNYNINKVLEVYNQWDGLVEYTNNLDEPIETNQYKLILLISYILFFDEKPKQDVVNNDLWRYMYKEINRNLYNILKDILAEKEPYNIYQTRIEKHISLFLKVKSKSENIARVQKTIEDLIEDLIEDIIQEYEDEISE